MPASLATVNALTKELYEGDLREQLNNDTVGFSRIEKTSEGVTSQVGGKYVTFPIHTSRNSGIGARNELEALPSAGQQGTAGARVGLKYLYGRIQLSGQTMELASSNAQAFMSALDLEVDGIKTDLKKDVNRQFYADGTGVVAKASAVTTAGNVITSAWTGWVQAGMQVDVIQATTLSSGTPTVIASNRQVTSVTPSNGTTAGTITLSGVAFTSAVGDIIVRTGNVNREWTGIGSILRNNGTLYNIDPAVVGLWKAEVLANGGSLRALSEGMMIQAADQVRMNGGQTTVILQSLGVRRAYFNLLSQYRSNVNVTKFEGGFSGLSFTTDTGEIPVVADPDCPPNTQHFLNEKQIKIYREADWSFMDRDGSMWQRVTGYDAYEATIYQYSEIGTHRRNTHAIVQDLIEG